MYNLVRINNDGSNENQSSTDQKLIEINKNIKNNQQDLQRKIDLLFNQFKNNSNSEKQIDFDQISQDLKKDLLIDQQKKFEILIYQLNSKNEEQNGKFNKHRMNDNTIVISN